MIAGPRPGYPSDMCDAEWEQLAPLIPLKVGKGRNRTVDLRGIMNVPFRVKTLRISFAPAVRGDLPRDLPNKNTVYDCEQLPKNK